MPTPTAHNKPSDTTAAVDRFMAELDHPSKDAIEALRELIVGTSDAVREGIKWNAPSYRTDEYFATTNLRAKNGIGLILHLGAKVRNETVAIDDPAHLLTWHASDRASLSFGGIDDLRARASDVRAIVVQWLRHV